MLGGLAVFPVNAEVLERLDFEYYAVNVSPGEKLLQAVNRHSKIRVGGNIFHGYTKWHVRWNYRWWQEPSSCRITETKVSVSGKITLPQLQQAADAERAKFDSYVAKLKEHEMGHYRIALAAAEAIDAYLHSLPMFSDCSALESQANQGASKILEDYRQRERRYYTDTGYGKTQGAYLRD
jgi:predicted secreted Zn-dependent protease